MEGITKYKVNKLDKSYREKSKFKKEKEISNAKKYRKKQKWV